MLRLLFLFYFIINSSFSLAQENWQIKTSGAVTAKPVVFDNLLYIASGKALLVTTMSGKEVWQYQLSSDTYSTPLVTSEVIYLLANDGLHAINHHGKRLWTFATVDSEPTFNGKSWGWEDKQYNDHWAWYRSSPIKIGENIIFANANGTYSINAATGTQKWHQNTGVTHTKPAADKNTIVVGSWDNNLYGLDQNSGEIKWQFTGRVPEGVSASWDGWKGFDLDPLIHKDIVYVGSRGSYFYAIKVATGEEIWSSQYANTWIGSPAIESDGIIYFGTSDGYSLVGLHARKGSQTLLYLNDFYNFAQPQANRDFVFYGSVSGKVYAVNKSTQQGQVLFSTEQSLKNYTDIVMTEGGLKRLYSDGDKYSHKTAVRDIKRMKNGLDSILSMTLNGNTLYLGSANGNVYAIDISNIYG